MLRRLLEWVGTKVVGALSEGSRSPQEPIPQEPLPTSTPKVIDASLGVFCAACGELHDYDAGPDEGYCLKCGGALQDVGDWLTPEEAARRRSGLLKKILVDKMGTLHKVSQYNKVEN